MGELVELATAEHVDWFNIRRLHPAIGDPSDPEIIVTVTASQSADPRWPYDL